MKAKKDRCGCVGVWVEEKKDGKSRKKERGRREVKDNVRNGANAGLRATHLIFVSIRC